MNDLNIKSFFEAISERKWIENDISDFLYALLKSSDQFFNALIKIILSNRKEYLSTQIDKTKIKREYCYRFGKKRADLFLPFSNYKFNNNQIRGILIEVKIGDPDIHKKGYNSVSKEYLICLIDIRKHEGKGQLKKWILITWDELIEKLGGSFQNQTKNFLYFFRKVLKMEVIKKVKLESSQLQSIAHYSRMIRKVINEKLENCKLTSKFNDYEETTWGHYFTYKNLQKKTIIIWFGLNLTNEDERHVGSAFFIEKNKNRSIYDYVLENLKFPNKYEIKRSDNAIILIDRSFLNKLNKKQTKEDQIKFVKDNIQRFLKLMDQI